MVDSIPLFPLGTVLFPGGRLPLRIFEPRYVSMIGDCMKSGHGFGVCAIRDGGEVGKAATPYPVGTLATIEDFDQGPDGMLQVMARGQQRFCLESMAVQSDQLVIGRVSWLAEPAPVPLPEKCRPLVEVLQRVMGHEPDRIVSEEARWDDGGWVSARLIEMLPFALEQRQAWLVSDDVNARLNALLALIR